MYLERTRTLVAEVRRMVAGVGEGQWVKEGSEESQGLKNRGPVLGKLRTPGSSDRKGGQLCQGVVCIWRSSGSLLSLCQYLITAQL